MSNPKANQVFGNTTLPQESHTESAEGVKPAMLFSYRFQNGMQAAVPDVRRAQRLPTWRLKQEARPPVSYVRLQCSCKR
jgi:hypothetical protein